MEYVFEVAAGYEVVFAQDEVVSLEKRADDVWVVDTGADETLFYPGTLVRWYLREATS